MSQATRDRGATSASRFKPYPAYKDSGVEWLGETPAHWETRRLRSTVASCQNGVWGDEPDGVHDVVCVRVADFDRVTFRVDTTDPTMRSVEPEVVVARGLHPGDLLLEKSGGGENQPVGAVVLYDHDLPAVCSNFVARVTVAGGYDARFLAYLHAALYALRVNTRHIKQSTGIQNLDSSSYLSEATGLPPEPEQCAISAFLDRETARIDALVAKKERLIELFQERRTALITRAVTKGLDSNVPMKDSGVEWLGGIPAHWNAMPLGQAMQLVMDFRGRTPLKLGMNWGGDVPAISAVNVRDGHIDLLLGVNYGSSPLHDRWMTQGPTQVGDIVFTTEAPLGNVAMVPDDRRYILSQRVVLLRPRPQRLDATYLFHFLRSRAFRQGVESRATGSTAEGVKRRYLMSMPVCVPPLDEQRSVSAWLRNQVSTLEQVLPATEQAIRFLKELRTALISAAVTGTIDVRENVA